MQDLIIFIINGALDVKVHSKLIYQNRTEMKTPKISNDYDNLTTYQLDLSSDCQDVTHKTPPFLNILLTPPHPKEGNDLSVIIDELPFQFNNSPINLDRIEFQKLNISVFSFMERNSTVTRKVAKMFFEKRVDEMTA